MPRKKVYEVTVLKPFVCEEDTFLGDTPYAKVTTEDLKEHFITLKAALPLLDLAWPQYVRRLMDQGKLSGIKVPVGNTTRVLVDRRSAERRAEQQKRRKNYRNFILRISLEDEAGVRAALKEAGIDYELEIASKKKKATETEETVETIIAALISG